MAGPVGDSVFGLGIKAAALAGGGGVFLSHEAGVLSLTEYVHVVMLVLLFPIYLLFVAMVLNLWLGDSPDESDLRPVSTNNKER